MIPIWIELSKRYERGKETLDRSSLPRVCISRCETIVRVMARVDMESKVSLEKAVDFTKLSVRLVCTWPTSKYSTKWQIARENCAWFVSLISVFCLLIPLTFSIYEYRYDSIIMTQSTGLACACVMIIIKSLVLRLHRKKCQVRKFRWLNVGKSHFLEDQFV